MQYLRNLLLTFLILFSYFTGKSNEPDNRNKPQNRPTVGLVLSGGGAKGFAYVGLLKVLDEVNMPVDYVGGTSIGAIVGGLYSVGYPADTIEHIIRSQDWDKVISSKLDRKYLSYEEREFSEKYKLDIPIANNKIDLKSSLAGSLHIDMLLQRYFLPVAGITDFNDLPVPFVCMGTDLVTGEAVELNSGSMARAIRASMAIPGYFPVVEYNGHHLVDGGVVNNYPAQQVKDMGADIIIGGDVQYKKIKDIDEITSLAKMFDHIVGFNRREANNIGRELTDYYVHFDMDYDVMSFSYYDSIIDLGERVARSHYDALKHLADSLNALEGKIIERNEQVVTDSFYVSDLRLTGGDNLHKKLAEGFFKDAKEGYASVDEVEKSIQYLYGTKSFSEIYYETSATDESNVLSLKLKPSGQGDLSAGVHFDTDYGGSILTNLTLRNLFNTRFKFFSDLVLGEDPRLKAQLILNNGYKPGFGLEADLYSFDFSLFDSVGKAHSTMHYENASASVFVPFMIRNSFMFRLGIEYNYFKFSQDFNKDTTLLLSGVFRNYSSFYAALNYDSRDRISFPVKGWNIDFKAKHTYDIDYIQDMNEYSQYSLYLKCDVNIPVNSRVTFKPGVFGGYVHHNKIMLIQESFGIGGVNTTNYMDNIVPFAGMRFIERQVNYAAIARAKLQVEPYNKFFITGVFDYGVAELEKSAFIANNAILGYGLKAGYSSVIGPVEVALFESSEHPYSVFYVNVGFWF